MQRTGAVATKPHRAGSTLKQLAAPRSVEPVGERTAARRFPAKAWRPASPAEQKPKGLAGVSARAFLRVFSTNQIRAVLSSRRALAEARRASLRCSAEQYFAGRPSSAAN